MKRQSSYKDKDFKDPRDPDLHEGAGGDPEHKPLGTDETNRLTT